MSEEQPEIIAHGDFSRWSTVQRAGVSFDDVVEFFNIEWGPGYGPADGLRPDDSGS